MPTHSPLAESRPVAHAFRELLADEGYRPRVGALEEDPKMTAIELKVASTLFVLHAYEDDPEYLQLGACYELGPGPHDPARLAGIANDLNIRLKGVKTVLSPEGDGVRFVVESFLSGQKVTPELIERATDAVRNAADEFFAAHRPPDRLDA